MESDAISWKEIDTLTKLLSDKIKATGKKFNSISTITRGGLVPSRLMADRLDINEIQVDKNKVTSDSLFVDDIYDSGDTFKKVLSKVENPNNLVYATLFARLSYAELSSVFPKAAAEYTFIKNSFKSNFLGFIIGWLTAITSIITASVVALGFGGYLAQFIDLPIVVSAILLLGALSIINFFGIRESSWTNIVLTLVEAAGLVIIIYIGFTYATPEPVNYSESPTGMSGIVIAFVLIFFAFVGFEDMANVAEEVKKPSRTIPKAILLSISITGVIYVLVSLAAVRVVSWQDLGASAAPLAAVAERALGTGGHVLLSSIALFATTNTVLIILIAGARMLYGMASDQSLPRLLGKIHFKTKTPWIAVIGIMLASMAFAFVGDIVLVANISVFAIVITFAMVNLAVIVLRYTEPTIERQ